MDDLLHPSDVLRVLRGFNPWWGGVTGRVPPFRRLAHGACRRYLEDRRLQRAVLLCGPRRVGKTTILQQLAEDLVGEGRPPTSIFYVSLDHPLLKLVSIEDILRLYHETVLPSGSPSVLLLDEVQYSTDWSLHLKQLIDRQPEYRIVATGSASVLHRRPLTESGVGRWIEVPVPTLSFFEFMQIRGEVDPDVPAGLRPSDLFTKSDSELSDLAEEFRRCLLPFRDYLLVGGFPETAQQDDVAWCQRLLREDVVERVLKRDMTALFGIRNVTDLERLFIYLCMHSGGIFAVKACAAALGTSATTVARYLDALEQANLVYRLPPAGTGGKKVLKARFKFYLVDAALRNAVLLRGREILTDPGEMGAIVETMVLRHLYAYHYPDAPQIVYWRDAKTGKEVDIIVKSPRYVIPVEVKYRERTTFGEKEGLVSYCRAEDISNAYWITQQDRDFGMVQMPGLETQFLKIPAHVFAYLIGQAERRLWES